MEAGAVGQPDVGVRRRVVQAPTAVSGQPLSQATDGILLGEAHLGPLEAPAAVEVDLVGAVDQDVGDTRGPQQGLEGTGTDHVAPQRLVDLEHRRVADRSTRGAQRLRDPVRREVSGRSGESFAHGVDQPRQLVGDGCRG